MAVYSVLLNFGSFIELFVKRYLINSLLYRIDSLENIYMNIILPVKISSPLVRHPSSIAPPYSMDKAIHIVSRSCGEFIESFGLV